MLDAARWTKKASLMGDAKDDIHLRNNFELCRAINLGQLNHILNGMVAQDGLHPDLALAYKRQAESLLAILRSENNRLFGF